MNDLNKVELEGIVHKTPEVFEKDGKKVLNFTISSVHFNSQERMDKQYYTAVLWNRQVDKYKDAIVEGNFVRLFGHLQAYTIEMEDGTLIRSQKVCVDHMEWDE